MTTRTVYVPHLIESAEQAEALPEETIAYLIHDDGFTDGVAIRLTQSGGDPRAWQVMGQFALATHALMRGWTALAPVEVEVEQIRESGGRRRTKTLYVTPWEEA